MASYVTTGVGDKGTTRTLGGEVISKSHPIVECTGQVDALRAHIAEVRLLVLESALEDREELAEFLWWLTHVCFLLGADTSDPVNAKPEWHQGGLRPVHVARLEAEQARLEGHLELPRAFIASASNRLAARIDVVTTEVRSLERSVVRLREAEPKFDAATILVFVNRLSDYLYILARYVEQGRHSPVDYSVLATGKG